MPLSFFSTLPFASTTPSCRFVVNRHKELTAFTPEMIISSYGLATAEAQELTTVAALYFVAPFSSADGHLAFWT